MVLAMRWQLPKCGAFARMVSAGELASSDDLFTASIDLGFGRYETKNQQDEKACNHTNEKQYVHDIKMALLVIRKESEKAHQPKGPSNPEEK